MTGSINGAASRRVTVSFQELINETVRGVTNRTKGINSSTINEK